MRKILNLMTNLYNLNGIDFLGYKVDKNNPYTFHHLVKKCEGGKETIKNGAILTRNSHQYLHIIESRDFETYIQLNDILKQINEQGFAPLERQILAVDYILRIFENEHLQDKTSSGKVLIRKEFLKR